MRKRNVLQEFERKEHKLKARAATNLAFLYSLEGDSTSAERYADLAVTTDKYSAQALVNKVRSCRCFACWQPKERAGKEGKGREVCVEHTQNATVLLKQHQMLWDFGDIG